MPRSSTRGRSTGLHRRRSRGTRDYMEIKRAARSRPARDRRMVHRHGPHRSAVPGARSGACRRRQRHLRARRPHRLAHASARPDADRHRRLRPGAARGGPIEEIRPGDVVWFAPGEKHWHGAAPTTAMTHIAIQERSTARSSTGWSRSATSNTGG